MVKLAQAQAVKEEEDEEAGGLRNWCRRKGRRRRMMESWPRPRRCQVELAQGSGPEKEGRLVELAQGPEAEGGVWETMEARATNMGFTTEGGEAWQWIRIGSGALASSNFRQRNYVRPIQQPRGVGAFLCRW